MTQTRSDLCGLQFRSFLHEHDIAIEHKMKKFNEESNDFFSKESAKISARVKAKKFALQQHLEASTKSERWKAFMSDIETLKSQLRSTGLINFIDSLVQQFSNSTKDIEEMLKSLCAQISFLKVIPSINDGDLLMNLFSAYYSNGIAVIRKFIESIKELLKLLKKTMNEIEEVGINSILRKNLETALNNPLLESLKIDQETNEFVLKAKRMILLKEKIPEKDKTIPVSQNPINTSTEKTNLSTKTDISTSAFPFTKSEDSTGKQWLTDLENNLKNENLSDEIQAVLEGVKNSLKWENLVEQRATESFPVTMFLDFVEHIKKIHQQAMTIGSNPFLKIFITIIDTILTQVQVCNQEEIILQYAAFLGSLFSSFSLNTFKQTSKIMTIKLEKMSSSLCLPLFYHIEENSKTQALVSEQENRVFMLWAALCGRNTVFDGFLAPIELGSGWSWLVYAVKQCGFLVSVECKIVVKEKNKLVRKALRAIRTFLRFVGFTMLNRYQNKFISLLEKLKILITEKSLNLGENAYDAVNKLVLLIEDGLRNRFFPSKFFAGQLPNVFNVMLDTRKLEKEMDDLALVEKDKKGFFMQNIKKHGIDRMRAIFNRLSTTVESQTTAVSQLLEKIVIASQESSEVLRFTLLKASQFIVTDCEGDFFNEMDEGHPTKLARVACSICTQIPQLGKLLKNQFNRVCPLTIPRSNSYLPKIVTDNSKNTGLNDNTMDLLQDMGFKKTMKGDEIVWESKELWLTRMSKLLCTYCVMMLQPEQTPLSVQDAWIWLADMINLTAKMGDSPSFFVATAFEIFLRVTGEVMYRTYGEPFMQLLKTIQLQILPKLSEDMSRRTSLEQFLSTFISSNGKDFMTLFTKGN